MGLVVPQSSKNARWCVLRRRALACHRHIGAWSLTMAAKYPEVLVRLDGAGDDFRIIGQVTGAEMPKPSARNDDRAIVMATFCWTTVRSRPRRPPIREEDPLFVRWRDHDPSRIALSHGNGDFGRRA